MHTATTHFDHVDRLDWASLGAQLDMEGYCLIPGALSAAQARELARLARPGGMLRAAPLPDGVPGSGTQYGFGDDLPAPLAAWRDALYPALAVIANRWQQRLGLADRFPPTFAAFHQRNRQAGQHRPQSHLSRLGTDDYLALHQRVDGTQVFPLQVVGLLSAPGQDFQGGEFVMTEQRPRMQSRPMVLPLRLGDLAIIGTAERPFRGASGDYRVNLRHAISRVRAGERIGLELSFHDAP